MFTNYQYYIENPKQLVDSDSTWPFTCCYASSRNEQAAHGNFIR